MLICSKPPIKSVYYCSAMLTLSLFLLILSGIIELPTLHSNTVTTVEYDEFISETSFVEDPFTDTLKAFKKWDAYMGCEKFIQKYKGWPTNNSSLQDPDRITCSSLKLNHVSILVKGWTWIPDSLNNLYSCRCGLTCLWTKSDVLVDEPEALFFETTNPPPQVHIVSYHAGDDMQATYAGALFHNNRNYYVSPYKNNDTLVYWSSSRCLKDRNVLAGRLLSLLPHHSFGKCLNNVGGQDMALTMYPECRASGQRVGSWSDHLHCAMSHYKFVLAIENTVTESYVTEKLFYAFIFH